MRALDFGRLRPGRGIDTLVAGFTFDRRIRIVLAGVGQALHRDDMLVLGGAEDGDAEVFRPTMRTWLTGVRIS